MEAYNLSHWEWDSFFKEIDCLVIGGGIVGLSAAIRMKREQPKMSVMVLDRGSLPIGASTRNAGFACFGSLSELMDDLEHNSKEEVLKLVERRYAGLQLLRQRYSDKVIGYEALGGFEVFKSTDQDRYQQCLESMDGFNKDLQAIVKMKTYYKADHQIQEKGLNGVAHMLFNQAEGQLNTGKLMRTLLDQAQSVGVRWLGGVTVESYSESFDKIHIVTDKGWGISAGKMLIATNGFARQLLPDLDLAPARNHVLITEPIAELRLQSCFHYDQGYVYFRNVGNRVLLGGGRNLDVKGEETDQFGGHDFIRAYLTNILHHVILPNQTVKIDRWWSGIMGVGDQKDPILKKTGQNIVIAVRLGGMGVALGTGVGEEAAGLLMGKE